MSIDLATSAWISSVAFSMQGAHQFTLAGWFNLTDKATDARLANMDQYFLFDTVTDGVPNGLPGAWLFSTGSTRRGWSTTGISNSVWTHIAFSWQWNSGVSGTLKFYTGGTLRTTADLFTGDMPNGFGFDGAGAKALNIGRSHDGTAGHAGQYAEVAAWQGVLSDANIADMASGGSGGIGKSALYYPTNGLFYYRMNDTSDLTDLFGNSLDGTNHSGTNGASHPSIQYSTSVKPYPAYAQQ